MKSLIDLGLFVCFFLGLLWPIKLGITRDITIHNNGVGKHKVNEISRDEILDSYWD